MIGKGTFGEVYRAMNCTTGQIFAVKKIYLNHSLGIDKACLKEIEVFFLNSLFYSCFFHEKQKKRASF